MASTCRNEKPNNKPALCSNARHLCYIQSKVVLIICFVEINRITITKKLTKYKCATYTISLAICACVMITENISIPLNVCNGSYGIIWDIINTSSKPLRDYSLEDALNATPQLVCPLLL